MKRIVYTLFGLLFFLSISIHAQNTVILALRDSLDATKILTPSIPIVKKWKVIKIASQESWDNLDETLKSTLNRGNRNVKIRVSGQYIEFGKERKEIINWKYPDANICIDGNNANMQPYGITFRKCDKNAEQEQGFYTLPYTEFDLNDIVLDMNGNEIKLREETKLVNSDIEQYNQLGKDVWRFKIDLPNLPEDRCKDFYVLMTRDWTSVRHKVIKVQEGWLYYLLDSDDLKSDKNPNVDWTQYKVRPRYTLINNPVSKGVHIVGGRIYIPKRYKQVRINKGGQLITFAYCYFNSLEITGFKLNGCGNGTPFGLYSSTFDNGAFIHDNIFTNMSSLSISTAFNKNVVIANNCVANTRLAAIAGNGGNTTISGNKLRNIGWMLNTRAITGGGENLHICDNVIEDFNYAAISCGSPTSNEKAAKLTYIIERNEIRQTKKYTDNYLQNTLADGGGIYIGPQCTRGIIRYNVVENIKGIHSNRGIFLDDGAKNLAIYGNLIKEIANSYDIDLRYSESYSDGIPDHNTHNCIFHNILTGYYRFEENYGRSYCFGGQNLIIGKGGMTKSQVRIKSSEDDIIVEQGVFEKNKMHLPKEYMSIIEMFFDPFVQNFITVR